MIEDSNKLEQTTMRLEMFSDGVFAIAITLLVLEIKVPHGPPGKFSLAWELAHLWPSYFGYIFSFLVIGIYWVNHHLMFSVYKRVDRVFLFLNVFLLMCIAFIPFPTAVLAKYISDDNQRAGAITFYTLGIFLPALGWLLKWLYASHKHRLIDPNMSKADVRYLTMRFSLTNALYLGAVILSFWSGMWALAISVGLMLTHLMPMKPPSKRRAS